MDRVETAFRLAFKVAPFVCYEGNAARNLHYSWAFHALKGHGFSRAVSSVLLVALDSLSKVKVKIKVKSCWGRGIKAFPCHRCHAATLVGTASDGQTRAPSNSASCLNMPKTACSSLRMTATSATILHLPRSCRAR